MQRPGMTLQARDIRIRGLEADEAGVYLDAAGQDGMSFVTWMTEGHTILPSPEEMPFLCGAWKQGCACCDG